MQPCSNAIIDCSGRSCVLNQGTAGQSMANLTIRDLDATVIRSLRIRAASRNRSMEEEARQILRAALLEGPSPAGDLVSRMRTRFVGPGDVELTIAKREPLRAWPAIDAHSPAARRHLPKRAR